MSISLSEFEEMEVKDEDNQPPETAQDDAWAVVAENLSSQLNEPCWSVVTYKSVAVSHLTYQEASQWAEDLKKQGISGLCVVTDEVAARVLG